MKKNNLKKIIILIVVIILAIIVFFMMNKDADIISNVSKNKKDIVNNNETIQQVNDSVKYFTVENAVNQYLSLTNIKSSRNYGRDKNNNSVLIVNEDTIKKNILDVLSKEYINQNKITENNVYDYIDVLEKQVLFIPLKMKVLLKENIEKYVVYGIEQDINNKYIKDIYLIVNLDVTNNTFSIEPITKEYKDIDEIDIENDNIQIEKNENNMIANITINDEYICKKHIDFYKKLAIGNPDIAYNYLNKEYREARYGKLDDFKQYVKNNKKAIQSITLNRYQVTEDNGQKQYLCEDVDEFYYIFKESAIMDFSLVADTHSIDIPEFTEEYSKASEQEKVAMNINKIVEALNMKDYKYVYNKFTDGFKKNYFKTEKDFTDFAKKYFKNNNKVKFNKFSKEANNTYIYNITLTDKKEKSTLELNTDIFMKLEEGTGFVFTMSGVVPEVIYNGV